MKSKVPPTSAGSRTPLKIVGFMPPSCKPENTQDQHLCLRRLASNWWMGEEEKKMYQVRTALHVCPTLDGGNGKWNRNHAGSVKVFGPARLQQNWHTGFIGTTC
jgi:hypothetical protein